MKAFESIKDAVELNVFGVCEAIGKRLNMNTGRIRLSFVYLSFLTFGSPVVVYLILHFWRSHRIAKFHSRRKNRMWELE
ncbi:MAG: PspC domain-containing protein [Bacteroidota bacterium]|jgi:phage shock protein PspC (stress-responsive transcriptional regulator)